MTDKKQPARKTPAKKAAPAAKKAPAKAPARKVATPKPKTNPETAPRPKRLTRAQKAAENAQAKAVADAAQAAAQAKASASVTDAVGEAKRAMGRPTKYSDDFIPQMIAFFNIDVEREEKTPKLDKEGAVIIDKQTGEAVMETIVVANRFPTLERFAAIVGVSRETLHDWATATHEDGSLIRPEFSYTYARAKSLQTALLTEGMLAGNYNSHGSIFALKNLSGWKDQIEQTITADVSTTTNEALDEIYQAGIDAARAAEAEAKQRELTGLVPGERK